MLGQKQKSISLILEAIINYNSQVISHKSQITIIHKNKIKIKIKFSQHDFLFIKLKNNGLQ